MPPVLDALEKASGPTFMLCRRKVARPLEGCVQEQVIETVRSGPPHPELSRQVEQEASEFLGARIRSRASHRSHCVNRYLDPSLMSRWSLAVAGPGRSVRARPPRVKAKPLRGRPFGASLDPR